MRQAGIEAAQGLAQGLRSQLGAVTAAIRQLAQAMVKELRKDLKAHSPSLVMAEIGESIPQGVALGIGRASHLAIGASSKLAASTVQPWGHAAGAGGGHVYNITVNGAIDANATGRQIHQILANYKRNGGGTALGLG